MNMVSRGLAREPRLDGRAGEAGSTIRFATDTGATVTIALENGSAADREEVLSQAKDAVRRLAAAFDEADAIRKKAAASVPPQQDSAATFRSWAYR